MSAGPSRSWPRAVAVAALLAVTAGCGGDAEPAPTAEASSAEPSVIRVNPLPDGETHTHAPGEGHATPLGDGTTPAAGGYRLADVRLDARPGRPGEVSFRVLDRDGRPVTEYVEEQTKLLHLYVVRTDLTDFRHLHPVLADDGTWTARVDLAAGGSHRVLAELTPADAGRPVALGVTVAVPGRSASDPGEDGPVDGGDGVLTAEVADGGEVGPDGRLALAVAAEGGAAVQLGSYLGTSAHLTGFRTEGGQFVHVHPYGEPEPTDAGTRLTFHTTFTEPGDYRLFLQVRVEGFLHTLPVTAEVTSPRS
ncbi:MAG TPA: hypothetical protein VD859_09715 [Nocardioides sp.]|nr:hypothetical protein [Nocardioides sp.]